MSLFSKYIRVAKWSEIYTDVGDYLKLVRRAWRLNSRQRELGRKITVSYDYKDFGRSQVRIPQACIHRVTNYSLESSGAESDACATRFTKKQNCSNYCAYKACENWACPMCSKNAKYFQVRRQYINVRDARNMFWGTRMAQRVRR